MEAKERTLNLPGPYTDTEEAILNFLYENPGVPTGTAHLLSMLRPERTPTSPDAAAVEARKKEFDEIQFGIETLIKDRLASGQRVTQYGQLQYVQLKLTPKGEAQAITEKRRIKEIVHTIPRPGDAAKE